ncbi:MAG: spore germination protein, partial [Lachnospiraceae bacterium]
MKEVSSVLAENNRYLSKILPVQKSFDVIRRDIVIGEHQSSFYFIDGFTKDEAMVKIMSAFFAVKKDQMPGDAKSFSDQVIPYVEVEMIQEFDQIIKNVLSGVTCLFVDGYDAGIAIDCRTYPARGVEEPEKDKALRGSRDGFVETVVFNTA